MQVLKYLFATFLITILSSGISFANDKFTISDITVEKKASDATGARKLAISEAESIAFDKLVRSMITDADYYKLPVLSKQDISALVKGYEVSDEKAYAKTYKATYSISFLPHMIKNLFEENEIEFSENKGAPTLVLPVYQEGNNVTLWDSENDWWDSWNKRVSLNNLIPMILPLGDIEDINLLKVEDVFSENYETFRELVEKYDAKDVLVVEVQYDDEDFSGKPTVDVVARLLNKNNSEKRQAAYKGEFGQEKVLFFSSVAKDLISRIEGDWLKKAAATAQIEEPEKPNVVVNIPISNLKDWLGKKKKISELEFVEELEVVTITSKLAVAKLYYKEDFATFSYFMGLEGYSIRKLEGSDDWYLDAG